MRFRRTANRPFTTSINLNAGRIDHGIDIHDAHGGHGSPWTLTSRPHCTCKMLCVLCGLCGTPCGLAIYLIGGGGAAATSRARGRLGEVRGLGEAPSEFRARTCLNRPGLVPFFFFRSALAIGLVPQALCLVAVFGMCIILQIYCLNRAALLPVGGDSDMRGLRSNYDQADREVMLCVLIPPLQHKARLRGWNSK